MLEFYNLLNDLEELVGDSPRVPLSSRVLVDEDQLLDILDRIRTSLPEEVRQAKWVMEEREKVLADAREEAQRIIQDAKKEVENRVEESEIVKQAQEKSEEYRKQAEEVADKIKTGAHQYADDILSELEDKLGNVLEEIKQGRNELQDRKKRAE